MRDNPDTADVGYSVPSEGSLFWLDTWVMLADAPHPNASYAWLDFIHRPEIQAKETEYNGYATPNDEARKLVSQETARRSGDLPAGRRDAEPRGRGGYLEQQPAARHLGRVQVEDRRLTDSPALRPRRTASSLER